MTGSVQMGEFSEAVEMSQANVEGIEPTRRRCRHARIEVVGGNSLVGPMLDLPVLALPLRLDSPQLLCRFPQDASSRLWHARVPRRTSPT